jgi:hypothetical protein
VIKIKIDFVEPMEMLIQALPIIGIAGIGIAIFYYLKRNDTKREELKKYIDENLLDKLEKGETDYQEIKEMKYDEEEGVWKAKIKEE